MEERYDTQKLFKLVKNIRLTIGDMSLQRFSVLLLVANSGRDGIHLAEIIRQSGVNQSNATKMIHNMSKLKANKKPGPGLVTVEAPDENLSMRVVKLTKRGQETMDMLFGPQDDA